MNLTFKLAFPFRFYFMLFMTIFKFDFVRDDFRSIPGKMVETANFMNLVDIFFNAAVFKTQFNHSHFSSKAHWVAKGQKKYAQ